MEVRVGRSHATTMADELTTSGCSVIPSLSTSSRASRSHSSYPLRGDFDLQLMRAQPLANTGELWSNKSAALVNGHNVDKRIEVNRPVVTKENVDTSDMKGAMDRPACSVPNDGRPGYRATR